MNKWYIIVYHLWFWIFVTGKNKWLTLFCDYVDNTWITFHKDLQFNSRVTSKLLCYLGIIPFTILLVINLDIFFALKRLKQRLKGSTRRFYHDYLVSTELHIKSHWQCLLLAICYRMRVYNWSFWHYSEKVTHPYYIFFGSIYVQSDQ